MAKLVERVAALGQAIAADISAILAKTNALKTAAYKDVGTTSGAIPEFVGVNGLGGFGYGGEAIKLAAGSDLNLLPRVNALYTAAKNDNILNRPAELVKYIFEHEFVIECIVGRTAGSYGTYIQRLTFGAFPPEGTSTTNPVVFVRSHSYLGFSPWVKTTGRMYGVDVGGDVVGEDLVVNSIKAGATSPKIAYEIVRKDINYSNFGYMPDGITAKTGGVGNKGYAVVSSSIDQLKVLSVSVKVFGKTNKPYGSDKLFNVTNKQMGSNVYYDARIETANNSVFVYAKTAAHVAELGLPAASNSGDLLFTEEAYLELFITYKVD